MPIQYGNGRHASEKENPLDNQITKAAGKTPGKNYNRDSAGETKLLTAEDREQGAWKIMQPVPDRKKEIRGMCTGASLLVHSEGRMVSFPSEKERSVQGIMA